MDRQDNVIHVQFGADGGYRITPPDSSRTPSAPPNAEAVELSEEDGLAEPGMSAGDPLMGLFRRSEVAKLFDLTENQLRYWERSEFLGPTARRGKSRFYTFQDLIGIRAAKGLLDQGIALREVRRSVDAIRKALPRVTRPLAELRVIADGHAMVVRDEDGKFDPRTGQRLLDFSVDSLREDVVRVLQTTPHEGLRRSAYECYLEGCRLDEDEGSYDEAERAYEEATRLDPSLANAWTNRGNLAFRRGDAEKAERLYHEALRIDPMQPEALYNLAFCATERNESDKALAFLQAALDSDPSFADAHFHMAATLETLGRKRDARNHWEAYLEFEPHGEWADIARDHLR